MSLIYFNSSLSDRERVNDGLWEITMNVQLLLLEIRGRVSPVVDDGLLLQRLRETYNVCNCLTFLISFCHHSFGFYIRAKHPLCHTARTRKEHDVIVDE